MAKRSGAPKGLLVLPIVFVLLGCMIVIANAAAPNEAVAELNLHPIPSTPTTEPETTVGR